MRLDRIEENVEAPEGVQISYADGIFTAKGEKGEVKKKLFEPSITLEVSGNTVKIYAIKPSKREKSLVFTFKSHVKNIIHGVQTGYTYKLKICAGHFPMNVAVNNGVFEVKNFLGEKVPRTVKLNPDATVKIEGDVVVVESPDKEAAGQTAADIEQLTIVRNRDRRIFQDGIFITDKDEKKIG